MFVDEVSTGQSVVDGPRLVFGRSANTVRSKGHLTTLPGHEHIADAATEVRPLLRRCRVISIERHPPHSA